MLFSILYALRFLATSSAMTFLRFSFVDFKSSFNNISFTSKDFDFACKSSLVSNLFSTLTCSNCHFSISFRFRRKTPYFTVKSF